MAARYWVGGSEYWDGTAGAKWALTSGGAGGQAVPTSDDDVFLDAGSGAVSVQPIGARVAKSINCTGFTGTFGGLDTLTVYGSVTYSAGMMPLHGGQLILAGTGTLTTAGKILRNSSLIISGSGITVTLGDALTNLYELNVTRGTFTTSASNYSITTGSLLSSNTNTRTISLNGSTVTIATSLSFATNTNLTFNAGTSTIIVTNNNGLLEGGQFDDGAGVTFYNVQFTSTAAGLRGIRARNTFNNLAAAAPSVAGVTQVTFDSRQTINGTLSTTGTAGNRRVWFRGRHSVAAQIAHTLIINSAPSLTDADFSDIYVIGTAAPISGTRVGDLRGCRGITFSTPKTVYWNLAGAQNWSANGWSDTSTGTPNTNFFPLAQDTATFTNAGSGTGTITMDSAVPYTGTVDMSGRTSSTTLSVSAFTIYGNWKNGSGTVLSGTGTLVYSGRTVQTITSAGKAFTCPITVDSYGGSVELADALNIGSNTLTVTNGAFDTKNFNVTAASLSSNNSNIRTITLGSSTLTLSGTSPVVLTTSTNLTFSAGTSQINMSSTSVATFAGGGLTFYNVSFTGTTAVTHIVTGANTFNNFTLTSPASASLMGCTFSANQTITGTLTVAGATPVRRIFVRSSTLGTQRTLSVGTLSATDCDFRDIAITGAAAGFSPTRAGDCGGNSGITFPAAKTVYWNLAGAQNWSATAWAPSSGGTPDINQFPLAQDTAVFDNTGSVTGTITMDAAWNIGTFDASLRTTAMTLTTSTNAPFVYGDWKFGTGVTSSSATGTITFAKRGTQTITSNGVQFGCPVAINNINGATQLADALSLETTRTLALTSGTFDAVTYNVTVGLFSGVSSVSCTLKMGSGTWTLSSTGIVWNITSSALNFYKGTANIVLSNSSTSARTFYGKHFSYNKLTIGGTTGSSTTTITDNNEFTELASTKTVAHTIDLGATTQTFGKWTVTGTVGNIVTLTGSGTSHVITGEAAGVNYLTMGSVGFASTSPCEFFAGDNSTGTAGVPVFRQAKPAARTLYWVGGANTWVSGQWSISSGGSTGYPDPRSFDNVIFDDASSGFMAPSYTITISAGTAARCKNLNIVRPSPSTSVTLAGTGTLSCSGNVTFPAAGMTRTFTGTLVLAGTTTNTLTTNGVTLASAITINGSGCTWNLGSALDTGTGAITITSGTFNLASFNLTAGSILSDNNRTRTINFSSGTTTLSSQIHFGSNEYTRLGLTVIAGTSQINTSSASSALWGNNQTFYNVAFTNATSVAVVIRGANNFNNLSFAAGNTGLKEIRIEGDQTVAGTLTFSASDSAIRRTFCYSAGIGTTCTITAAAVIMTDVDFRDITIAGAAAPASGTRIGDAGGNTGIIFTPATNKYWNLAAGGNWSATGWAITSGGTPAINNFPLPQDTCIFEATGLNSGATVTINTVYNIGTIDMSARTVNTMTLATTTAITPVIYGNWINGTGTTLTGTGLITFAGRGNQTITSAGKTFTQPIAINSPSGSVTLEDAFLSSSSCTVIGGTFNANIYNVTITNFDSGYSTQRTVAIGSGTWTITATPWSVNPSTDLTVTGTGTISLTSASAKTFTGGSMAYTDITLNQGGAGTLTITGSNTFKDITNTYKTTGATTITIGQNLTQRVSRWTAAGENTRPLTIQNDFSSSPVSLVFTGSGQAAAVDYLTIKGIIVYPLNDTWYAGTNSTNSGSLGWIFDTAPVVTSVNFSNFLMFFFP